MINNPLMLLYQAMRSGQNPVAFLQQYADSNPQIHQALSMIQGKTPQQLETMTRNIAREKGVDLDALMHQMGIK